MKSRQTHLSLVFTPFAGTVVCTRPRSLWVITASLAIALGLSNAAAAQDMTFFKGEGSKAPFSDAVRAGDFLFVSGQIGTGEDPDPAAAFHHAAHEAMDTIAKILTDHGSSLSRVVQCTVMLADMKTWAAFNAVYTTYFPEGRLPARSAFGATALAKGAPLEVSCFAYQPQGKSKQKR